MEYEVFFGCNIVGTIIVVLILIYHIIGAKQIKSLSDESMEVDVSLSSKKSQ
jgi:hypothetical protein